MQRKPDISLAKERLNGWGPEVQLDEGLDKAIFILGKWLELI